MSNEAASQIVDEMQTPSPTDPNPGGGASTDALAPQAPATAKPDERVSARLNIALKKEGDLRAKEMAIKAKEAELEATLGRIREFESSKGNSKKALELLGLTYDELTQSLLQDGQIPPEVEVKKLRQEWEQERKAREAAEQERAEQDKRKSQEQEERAITDFKSEISTFLSENGTRYELIAFEGQEDLVFDVIDEHYARTIDPETGVGKVMTIAQAADRVEAHLEKKYEKSRELSKVQTLWNALPKDTQNQLKQTQKTSQPPKTLTNQLSATPMPPKRAQPISDEERIQKAIAYARGLRP